MKNGVDMQTWADGRSYAGEWIDDSVTKGKGIYDSFIFYVGR